MTRDEILLNSIWTSGKINVYSEFFQQDVRIDLFTSEYTLKHTKSILSEKFVQAVNDFLKLSKSHLPLMKRLLYQHCLDCCKNISYGIDVLEGETETQANLRAFQVHDASSAFQQSNLDHVVVDESEQEINRFVKLVFYPAWENEHGCELIIKNGLLLDFYGENGTYIGQFNP